MVIYTQQELLKLLGSLDDGSVFYKNLRAKVAQNELNEAEMEHFMLRILHRNQSRKSKRRMVKRLENL